MDTYIPGKREWVTAAACRDEDPELFYSVDPREIRRAKQVCAGCPVAVVCLQSELQHPFEDQFGVFGGHTDAERQALLRRGRSR